MAMPDTPASALAALPEPSFVTSVADSVMRQYEVRCYTADQMRAYGEQCAALARQASPRMGKEAEQEHFKEWITTACPFDENVGMVENAIQTSAAWAGWLARSGLSDWLYAELAEVKAERDNLRAALSSQRAAAADITIGNSEQHGGWCVYEQTSPGNYEVLEGPFPTREQAEAALQPLAQPVAWGFPNTAITGANRWMMLRERCGGSQVARQASALTVAQRIAELISEHGTLRAVARALQLDVGYLSRLEHGEKDNPSPATLEKLGLRQVVLYERAHGIIPAQSTQEGA